MTLNVLILSGCHKKTVCIVRGKKANGIKAAMDEKVFSKRCMVIAEPDGAYVHKCLNKCCRVSVIFYK
jgi:hypothetical protein